MSDTQTNDEQQGRQGILLTLFLIGLSAASIWLFTQRYWWMTPLASEHGSGIDGMFQLTLLITGVLFVLLQLFLAVLVVRYRNRGADTSARPVRAHVQHRFALVAGIVIFGVDVTVFALGESQWMQMWHSAPGEATVVEVDASQFMWHFRYPGKDGAFGKTSRALISLDNPIGLDPNDAASKDDVVIANEFHVTNNQRVKLKLKAKDVIHSLYLPHFRVKQDLVPGMEIEVSFVPTREGRFEIACNQLCGMLHHKMRGFLVVESREQVDAWLAKMAELGGD